MSHVLRRAGRSAGWGLLGAVLALLLGSLPLAAQAQYTWRNVMTGGGGGFVPGIVFNEGTPDLLYARTDIGGAYRWNSATGRWIQLLNSIGFDDWNLTGVDSLATDAVDPNRLYILAGTYTNAWTTQNGAILRSTDRGDTFQRTMLPFKSGGNMPGRNMGERLAIDPNRNSVLYLGARSGNGLWRSTDFGVTWAKVTSFPTAGTFIPVPGDVYQGDIVGVTWVTFDPSTGSVGNATQTIYVGVADKGNSVYRSTNGGTTWAAVPGQPTGFLPHHGTLGPNGMLYITYSDGGGPYDGIKGDVWKFNTASGAWTLISPVPSTLADDYFGYGGLAVDQQLPGVLMVAALNSWWPDTIIFRSTNDGATWTRIWDWTSYPNRSFRYVQDISAAPWLTFGGQPQLPEVTPKLGWMIGDLEIDPFNSNRMLYGTGATIYGAEDLNQWDLGGQIHISVKAQGIEEMAVLDLISPPSGAPLLSGIGDVNGFRHNSLTTAPAAMFSTPSFAAAGLDYAELSPGFIVRVGQGNASATPPIRGSGFSFDGGTSWFQGNSEPGGVTGGGSVAAAANASRVVWSPSGAQVSISSDNGNSWTTAQGIPSGARVGSDRVNPMKFYGFANGTFYVSTNGGVNFTATAAIGLPPAGTSARFKAVAGIEGDVWLAGGSTESGVYGIWHSTNSGASFTKLANVEEADNIGFGLHAPAQTYPALYSSAQLGGVRGIYRSDDAGASWLRINDDQHQFASTGGAITGDPRVYGRVYLSTNGLGIPYGDIGAATPDFALSANPNSLTVNRGASGTSTITVTRISGFSGSVAFTISGLPSGVTASFNPTSTTTTGTTSTLTLTASSTATTGPATVTVTGTGGGLTHTAAIGLTIAVPATPDFSLAASPTSLSVNRGASGTDTIAITRLNGFTAGVTLSATGLPSGVTASFNPTSATGASSVLTLTASATATLGAATVTVTGTSGTLTHTATIALTVAAPAVPDFSLAASPTSLSVNRGASGTDTITITRLNGFTAGVTLSATGLPTGVTAAFNPTPVTGASSVLTLTASATATLGVATVTVTGTSGALTHTATIALTVNAGGGTGGVTVTPVVSSSSPWFNQEDIQLGNTAPLTALSITVTIQRTGGISHSGQYNTVGGQFTQTNSSTATAITYQFTLGAGQTLGVGTGRLFATQQSGTGSVHPATGDLYTVTYTTGGASFTQSGHF
jgi:xyloglucan-specific exo-beta-1,4-glucanase